MSLADLSVVVSFLVVLAVIVKMLKAIRLLDARVTLLQEQIEHSREAIKRATVSKMPVARTPVEGVPATRALSNNPRTPTPIAVNPKASTEQRTPGEVTTHTLDEAEAEARWATMNAEQERLKQAMGRDFQVRSGKRSAAAIRGKPVERVLSARDLAAKLERK